MVEERGVRCRMGQPVLPGEGIEIGIPQLHGDAGGQPAGLPKLEGELRYHLIEGGAEEFNIRRIGLKSTLRGDGLPLGIGHDGPVVNAVRFFPQLPAGLAKFALQQQRGHLAERLHCAYAHLAQPMAGDLPHRWQTPHREWGQKLLLPARFYELCAIGLAFPCADLRNELVNRQANGQRQAAFANDLLPQLLRPFPAAEVAVHTTDVQVKFINGSLFEHGSVLRQYFRNQPGMLQVAFHIAPQHRRVRAAQQRMADRHAGADAKAPRFITAACDHAPAAAAANDQWLALQFAVVQLLYGHKKGIEVQVEDGSFKHAVWFFLTMRGLASG